MYLLLHACHLVVPCVPHRQVYMWLCSRRSQLSAWTQGQTASISPSLVEKTVEAEASIHTGSPKLDYRRLEKKNLFWWVLISAVTSRCLGQNLVQTTSKHGSTLPCNFSSGCCWWCDGVGDNLSANFRPLGTKIAQLKWHSLPGYRCWPCPSCRDHSALIVW